MSCQPSSWVRRNVSPSSQHRPVRATVPVSLMRQTQESPTKNPTTSNTPNENPPKQNSKDATDDPLSQDKNIATERPTIFLGPRGEKSKTLNLRTQPPQHCLRRTASLDAIYVPTSLSPEAFFLSYSKRFTVDKITQTPEDWTELDYRKTPLKPIASSGEQLEVKYIRQKLQRTNQNNRNSSNLFSSQHQSPVHGDHSAISVSTTSYQTSPPLLGVLHKSVHTTTTGPISRPIPIVQSSKLSVPRLQNSVEGLNQEIERLVLRGCSGLDSEFSRVVEPTPDGHRAPIAELFHSIQSSPSTVGRDSRASSGSRSHSISPATPIIPGNPEFSISPYSDESESMHKLGTSPHISQFLAREPPDGCEKVMEEPRRQTYFEDFSNQENLVKPKVLLPSQCSAFYPLYKGMKPSSPSARFDSYSVASSTANCQK